MTIVTATPGGSEDLYTMLVEKERDLRRVGRGTLHRKGPRKSGQEKWVHASYKGWIKLQKGLGGVVIAQIHGTSERDEWQLLTSLVGFLHRHLREEIASVNLSFGE